MDIVNPTKSYEKSRNTVYSCQYHVIFATKYRRPILTGEVEAPLKDCFEKVSEKYGFKIIEMEIMPDHVHLLMSVNPEFGINTAVSRIKGASARFIGENFPNVKSRVPCIWTSSKFISTVGAVSLDVVKKYIEDQKNV